MPDRLRARHQDLHQPGDSPTTEVSDDRWGLSARTNKRAAEHVDAYLWFGRPWLYRQNQPFVMKRALGLIRSSPYTP